MKLEIYRCTYICDWPSTELHVYACTYIYMYIHVYIHDIFICMYIYVTSRLQSCMYIYVHIPQDRLVVAKYEDVLIKLCLP